ncbi:CBS domain-containing protein [Vibrio sp. MEBiC08052]|uniref:CBS domain-containing protein n=1 Tax=Vibrio sp. MEBiC08052 TaxID=1761910 RepID=UPI0007407E83|nr:CBS domain-containing protein [Vibrio sp. MEBiC08052]KUI99875.1 inosine monophosphate dehydrogenase-related protein [Vibrio sp. MEBiC08052]
MESLKVRHYMTQHSITFKADMSLSAALERVIEFNDFFSGPVIDDHGRVIGFLSEHDLLDKLVKVSYFCQDSHMVGDCMTPVVDTVSPDLPIIELADYMRDGRSTYPVVEDGRLVGVINRRAVLKAINKNLHSCFKRQV